MVLARGELDKLVEGPKYAARRAECCAERRQKPREHGIGAGVGVVAQNEAEERAMRHEDNGAGERTTYDESGITTATARGGMKLEGCREKRRETAKRRDSLESRKRQAPKGQGCWVGDG